MRRAHIADVAAGFDGLVPVGWIKSSGASVSGTLSAWDQGQLAEVPAGIGWDVVRMGRHRGWRTVDALRLADEHVGPVLVAEPYVEVLVPLGSADGWDQDGVTVLAAGELVPVPPPAVVAPRTLGARSWIVPPHDTLTDGAKLYEAYAAAGATLIAGELR
ncbi:hypothetical protein ACFW20_07350 [Streptomyces nigra]|uniref:hypothetical protein n=1 Tax=Streptomyces nigra TaxID=1827580 RepID=UPI0036896E4D